MGYFVTPSVPTGTAASRYFPWYPVNSTMQRHRMSSSDDADIVLHYAHVSFETVMAAWDKHCGLILA